MGVPTCLPAVLKHLLRRGSFTLQLVVFADQQIAPQPGQVIDKQHAVQVIDLMLDHGGLQIGEVPLLLAPIDIHIADTHQRGPLHLGVHLRNGEAAFVVVPAYRRSR